MMISISLLGGGGCLRQIIIDTYLKERKLDSGVRMWVGSESVSLLFDPEYPNVVISGIDCEGEEDSCMVIDAQPRASSYRGETYTYVEAQANMGLVFTSGNSSLFPLRFRLVRENWPLSEGNGVLGFSPQSEFVRAGFPGWKRPISLALPFVARDAAAPWAPTSRDCDMALVLARNENDFTFLHSEAINSRENWEFATGSLDLPGTTESLTNALVSLNFSGEQLLYVEDPHRFEASVRKLACPASTDSCLRSDAELSRLPPLVMTIGSTVFSFEPFDFIFFDSTGELRARVGPSKRSEDPRPRFTLGRPFMAKYPPVVSFPPGGHPSIALIGKIEVKTPSTGLRKVKASVLFGFALAMALSLWVKRKEDREDLLHRFAE